MIKKLTLTLVAFLAVVIGFLTIAPSEMSFDDAGYNSKNALEHLQAITKRTRRCGSIFSTSRKALSEKKTCVNATTSRRATKTPRTA